MREMADPMLALRELQQSIHQNNLVGFYQLGDGYLFGPDERSDEWKRYLYAKVINREVLALAIFVMEDPFKGVARYSVGYAVTESHRGYGLAFEAVNKGIDDLRERLNKACVDRFYLEAIVGVENLHSQKVAQKLFPGPNSEIKDEASGQLALLFYRLISVK